MQNPDNKDCLCCCLCPPAPPCAHQNQSSWTLGLVMSHESCGNNGPPGLMRINLDMSQHLFCNGGLIMANRLRNANIASSASAIDHHNHRLIIWSSLSCSRGSLLWLLHHASNIWPQISSSFIIVKHVDYKLDTECVTFSLDIFCKDENHDIAIAIDVFQQTKWRPF